MPAFAVLGATGATGGNILKLLIKDPTNIINVYVRSKSKLLAQTPDISSNKQVRVFTGNLTDTSLIASCLRNTDAVFSTVASNDNMPGTHIAQDAAQSIVVALMEIRMTKPDAKIPTIVWLSSASVNPHFYDQGPAFVHWLLATSFSYVYSDLAHAEEYLKLHQKWLKVVFIQPGGLVEDKQHGHALSLERQKTFLSYADLAAGMIEVAEKGGYDWQAVAVVPIANNTAIEWRVPGRMIKGLTFHFAPWMYWLTKALHLH
ncbi:MAG: hypothetical protein LQ348_005009 [Seirophora lacunosa]|nr:MAG: hypothetical protein LQ344_007991 [Seirophora lacunosa]KAI4181476.1 MAG: hypothetical protein LQ348_005009 [Seirophora lacunosa]